MSGSAVRTDYPWKVKNVYEGAKCPPGSSNLVYQGTHADVFEPNYKHAIENQANKTLSSNPWNFMYAVEEADWVFGFATTTHDHMGYIILSQNPYRAKGSGMYGGTVIDYPDQKLYSKYAMRDFLRFRHKPASETLIPLTINSAIPLYTYSSIPSGSELIALQNLNMAWGANYTTWDTSSGNLNDGTNAYGKGSGFMDENGKSVFSGYCGNISYEKFSKPRYSSVKKDLDDFIAFFAERYGLIIYSAVRPRTVNLIALPFYNPPDFVAGAVQPYADVLWTSIQSLDQLNTRFVPIYNNFRKPIHITDYRTSNHDSPLDFGGLITALSYDAAKDTTTISYTGGRPYKFRMSWLVEFPEAKDILPSSTCGYRTPTARPKKISWDSIEISYNYAKCLKVGQRIRISDGLDRQEDRAQLIKNLIDGATNTKGDDGTYFVAGWEHWSLMDNPLLHGNENFNFGFVTALDNAYDGVEARKTVGKDANGRWIGGEDDDYGVFIGPSSPLTIFLNNLYDKLITGTSKIDDNTPPSISSVSINSITINSAVISWKTSELSNSEIEYGTGILYGQKIFLTNQVTTHTATLDKLLSNTVYHFRVKSRDASGNAATSNDFTFVTLATIPISPVDSDNDGIPDILDKCPGTTSSIVNIYGCPLSLYTKFSNNLTTNLSQVDLKSISSFSIGIDGIGKIVFNNAIDLIGDYNNPTQINLDSAFNISVNKIGFDDSLYPQFNTTSTIILLNLNISNPVVIKDNSICTECSILSFADNDILFIVPHFTEYSVDEGYYCGDSYCSSLESCSACSTDCGSCPAESSSGSSGGSGGGSGGSSGGGGSISTETLYWQCSDWSSCSDLGIQTRTCSLVASLSVSLTKPSETQTCKKEIMIDNQNEIPEIQEPRQIEITPEPKEEIWVKSKKLSMSFIVAGIMFVVIVLVGGGVLEIKSHRKKEFNELEKMIGKESAYTLFMYVKLMRSKGLSNKVIKESLIKNGWEKGIIEKVLKGL